MNITDRIRRDIRELELHKAVPDMLTEESRSAASRSSITAVIISLPIPKTVS
jgi:hypothetical protein